MFVFQENGRTEPPTSDEAARVEINHLRQARETLVKQRKELADLRKRVRFCFEIFCHHVVGGVFLLI